MMATMLFRALGICPGDVVAFTGGGGKTSLARVVARELQNEGRPVIFTTTTKTFPGSGMELVLASTDGWQEVVRRALAEGRNVCLAAGEEDWSGKLVGLEPERVEELRAFGAGAILVEADGSRGLPLKAPAGHEPVIPGCTDIVVPVAGASVLGAPLSPTHVHRAEEVMKLTGRAAGSVVTAEVVIRALLDPTGCVRGTPAGARVVPVLSQADVAEVGALDEVVRGLGERAGRAVLAAPRTGEPVRGVYGPVSALVLAGGLSSRFGTSKLLHPFEGRTILEAALQGPLQGGLREVVVVTGAYHDSLAPMLAPYPVRVVQNLAWNEGMSASLRAGVEALQGDPPEAVVVCLGDQPFMPAEVIRGVVSAYREGRAKIVAPAVLGARRSPVLFDWGLAPELLAVRGDEGGRSVVARHAEALQLVSFADEGWFIDIDTPTDLTHQKSPTE